jgi:PAS domain S-box-containing protein
MGEKASEITADYLKGHLKLNKPITTFSTAPQLMLDWNALVRWKVETSTIPKGCTIINEPVSFWQNYKETVTTAIIIFLSMGTLSCILWFVNRRLKRLTIAAGKSEAYYRSIFSNSLIGITVTDKNFMFTDVNDAFCRMLGYSREELVGKMTISDLSSPGDVAKSMDMINKLMRREIDHYTIEKRYISKNGEDIPALVYVKGRYSRDGQYEGTTASNLDITERKHAEALLMENEEKYRTLFNNSEVAMFRSRPDGSAILEVNQKFLDLVGKSREQVVGKPSTIFWEDLEEREEMLHRLMAGERVSEFEVKLVHAKKGVRTCITSLKLYKDQELLEGSIIDITGQKQAEQEKAKMQAQLLQAQKMESVGQLAGGVAHDFNNMLGVILGHTDLAMDEIDQDHPIYNDLLEIKGAADRSASIVRQLLAFARKQMVTPKVIDLNVAVEEMMKMLRRLIGEDIDLIWKPGPHLWKVKIDPSQVDQLLANLCVNARDAISHTGSILVETENLVADDDFINDTQVASGEYVLLKVRDSGSGIPKTLLSHIFEPFFTTKGVGKGTGLGLSTVYGIVKQNNGFIHVESDEETGTSFLIFLPRHASQTPDTDSRKTASLAEGGNETILLVEDEPAIMKMTSTMLERLGYTVMPANRPNAAVKMAEEHKRHIDLLMTDVIMPEMNGKDLANEILKMHPEAKCLFMSGYTADTIGQQVILENGFFFIQKPFAKRDIAAKIREVLNSRKP